MTWILVLLSAVALLAALTLAVVAFAARAITIGSSKPIAYQVDGDGNIRLPTNERTTLPGQFGLLHDSGRGHIRVGAVVKNPAGSTHLTRKLEAHSGTVPASNSTALWVRDAYRTPADLGLAFEEVHITTETGPAPAWVIYPSDTNCGSIWAIHLHGIRTTRSVVLPGLAALRDLPVTSLVPSWRGDSEGPPVPGGGSSLGTTEWSDVEVALRFAHAQGATSVLLVGWSLGGTIARLLLHRSELSPMICGMVLVAPVISWQKVVAGAIGAAHLPAILTSAVGALLRTPILCRLAGIRQPIHLDQLEVGQPIPGRDVPTLVIHNPADELVPHALITQFVSDNAPNTRLVTFPPAPHAMEWNTAPEQFHDSLQSWFIEQLNDLDGKST